MNRIITILFCFFVYIIPACGQTDSVKYIYNNCSAGKNSVALTSDSCYIIFTITNDSSDNFRRDHRINVNHYDFLFLKFDKNGNVIKGTRFIDNESHDQYAKVLKTRNNCIYLAGLKEKINCNWSLRIFRMDSNATNYLWDSTYFISNYYKDAIVSYDITEDVFGNLTILSYINDSLKPFDKDHLWITKINENGEVILKKRVDADLIYQRDIDIIQNYSCDGAFYIRTRREIQGSLEKFDSTINTYYSAYIKNYDILKISNTGEVLSRIKIPVQTEVLMACINKKKQFMGFVLNDFSGFAKVKSFNPSKPDYFQRVDSSYLSLIIIDSAISKTEEKPVKNFPLLFSNGGRVAQPATDIISLFDSTYAFLYTTKQYDSVYVYFAKTDANGNMIINKVINIEPFVFDEGVGLLAVDSGFVLIGGTRKISDRYLQHLNKLRMIKLDLNGKMKTF